MLNDTFFSCIIGQDHHGKREELQLATKSSQGTYSHTLLV